MKNESIKHAKFPPIGSGYKTVRKVFSTVSVPDEGLLIFMMIFDSKKETKNEVFYAIAKKQQINQHIFLSKTSVFGREQSECMSKAFFYCVIF